MSEKRKPSFAVAISVLSGCFAIIFASIFALQIDVPIALFVCMFIAIILGLTLGYSYNELEESVIESIKGGLQSLLILIVVGAMVGTWIAAGTVPSMIYYGLKMINPRIFLLAALLICSITSLATGTSWGTAGTAGIAMIGIGEGLGIPAAMTAGAVLSGAYFGDKMSPLSDSTNLTASMSGVDVFTHVKSMLYSTVPSYIITALLYLMVGWKYGGNTLDQASIDSIFVLLSSNFNISVIMLVPAVVVIGLMVLKKPALPSIAIGVALGSVWAILFQGKTIAQAVGVIWGGYSISTKVFFIDRLLNRGGMTSMLYVVAVMLFGLGFGGVLKKTGVLEVIIRPVVEKVKNVWQLIVATVIVGHVTNAAGCSMYISLIMTPQMMKEAFKKFKLKPEVLSRTTEDGGTLSAPLYPWTDNALYMTGVLGVSTLQYVPWSFFLIITPIVSILLAVINGWGMFYEDLDDDDAIDQDSELALPTEA